jgi:23S rRNA (uracil1939-C5)-methyltransferase
LSRKHKQKPFTLENIQIENAASEGKSIAKHDGKVIFIPFSAPGDVVNIKVNKQKKSYAEGQIIKLIQASPHRIQPLCEHFGKCGGCKWQHVDYKFQLNLKSKQVQDDMERIAKVDNYNYLPILGAKSTERYRNKLEFTFSNKAWEEHFDKENPRRIPALGFHIPGMFDKVLDINDCHLAPEIANQLRNALKNKAIEMQLEFFDIRQQTGLLRNLMLRSNSKGEWMLVLIVTEKNTDAINTLFESLIPNFPKVIEWCYVINNKKNDTWTDLEVITYKGKGYLISEIEDLNFKIRPQSFFQTNHQQAYELYQLTREFADFKGNENVYDLYTGTGSIAQFVAKKAKQVIGIEYVEAAVQDAKENAILNQLNNVTFYAGDMKLIFNDELIAKHGKADVVITDPPRDGMHPDVIQTLLKMSPDKIVYVSCNPATQARDIALLKEQYDLVQIQAVDMFPHTHHVESVALFKKKL